MLALDIVFSVFGLVIVSLALYGFFWHHSQASKDRAVKRELALRFRPDQLGNYDQALLSDGTMTDFRPGNKAFPEVPHYLIQPQKSEVVAALPKPFDPVQTVYGSVVSDQPEPKQLTTQAEVVEFLIDAKKRGLTKTAALRELGITGGDQFKKLAKQFDALP
jgi:hypothetical protein